MNKKFLRFFIAVIAPAIFFGASLLPAYGQIKRMGSSASNSQKSSVKPLNRLSSTEAAAPVPAPSFNPAQQIPVPAQPKRKWVLLTYMNGTSEDTQAATARRIQAVTALRSTKDFAVVAELGSDLPLGGQNGQPTEKLGVVRLYMTENGEYEITSRKESADMGDYRNLSEFIRWSKKNFPAEKYALVITGHGLGYLDPKQKPSNRGMMFDDKTGNYIRTQQTGLMLKEAGGIDVFIIESCLMQMMEVLYEVGTNAKYVVGSEESLLQVAIDFTAIGKALAANPGMSAEDLSRTAVQTAALNVKKIREQQNFLANLLFKMPLTFSAIRTDRLPAVTAALNKWTELVMALPKAEAEKVIKKGIEKALRLDLIPKDKNNLITPFADLGDFVANASAASPKLAGAAGDFKNALNAAVVEKASRGKSRNAAYGKAAGISVGLPNVKQYTANIGDMEVLYADYPFAKQTNWGKFCAFIEQMK